MQTGATIQNYALPAIANFAFAPLLLSNMSVDAIEEAIAALLFEERHALASWLNELE